MNKKLVAGFVATFVVGVGLGTTGNSSASSKNASPSPTVTVTATRTVTASPAPASTPDATTADTNLSPQQWATNFQAWVSKHGTSQQKAAAKHVTEIKGLNGNTSSWTLTEVEVYTDFGGSGFEHNGEAKLIVDALGNFAPSQDQSTLATVYNANGDIEGNGDI